MTTFRLPNNPVRAHAIFAGEVWRQVKALAMAGHATELEVRTAEDKKTDAQRRYYHGYVLHNITLQAAVNGQKFSFPTWKEYYRAKFLGFKVQTYTDPMTGKKVRRRVRVSTEDLGVKGYSQLIEKVTADAAVEHGVTFAEEWVDPDSGEVYQLTAMKSRKAV